MGRRSRKRVSTPSTVGRRVDPPPPPPRRRSRRGEAPEAPWGSFPLVELCVLTAMIIAVVGLLRGDNTGRIMLAGAMALGSLAGLELSIREHFAGYKPHSLVLAATVAVALLAVLFFARAPRYVLPPAGAAVFGVCFWLFRGAYNRRSGGLPT